MCCALNETQYSEREVTGKANSALLAASRFSFRTHPVSCPPFQQLEQEQGEQHVCGQERGIPAG